MLVRELMTHDPVTVAEDTPVKQALSLLATHEITSMPVVDRRGELRGIVSEADLVRDLVSEDPRAHERPVQEWRDRPSAVRDVMTRHVITVRPDTDVAEAVELVTATPVKSVPVVHHGRVVGMLSRSDVVQALARNDDDLARDVDALLAEVGLGDWVADVTDGSVVLSGPPDARDRALAHLLASTVPGVVDVVED